MPATSAGMTSKDPVGLRYSAAMRNAPVGLLDARISSE
jgi:hypothetical protein